MFIASLVADIVKVCLMTENFKDSLRYIQLDIRGLVSRSRRLTPIRVLNFEIGSF